MREYFILALTLMGFLFAEQMSAQSPPPIDPEAPTFSIAFLSLGWDEPVSDVFYFSGTQRIQVVAPVSRPSPVTAYTGPNPLIFYREGPPDPETGMPTLKPVAVLDVQRLSGQQLLIFVRTDANPEGAEFRISTFPDPPGDIRGGTLRFINLTPYDIACLVNEETLQLPSRQMKTVVPEPRADKSLPMKVAAYRGSSWEMAFSTVINYHPEQRITIFITEDGNKRIRFRRITEMVR